MAMTTDESKEFGELKGKVDHVADLLDELAPLVRSSHARLEKQAGFVTGVAVTVSAAWALLLAFWHFVVGSKPS